LQRCGILPANKLINHQLFNSSFILLISIDGNKSLRGHDKDDDKSDGFNYVLFIVHTKDASKIMTYGQIISKISNSF
jgi:hypothetical protein